jgi:hypothetical protein
LAQDIVQRINSGQGRAQLRDSDDATTPSAPGATATGMTGA